MLLQPPVNANKQFYDRGGG